MTVEKKDTSKTIEKKETVISKKDYMLQGFNGTEKIYYNQLANIDLDVEEDYPLYKSKIEICNKEFDVYIKFNVGRKTSNFLHTIVTNEGNRVSLGFTNNIGTVRRILNNYILNQIKSQKVVDK